jgi:eukaryotic-like serine/threonine-protein kinase
VTATIPHPHPSLDEDFRYGQLAIEGRLITPDQFDAAMDKVKASGRTLAAILVDEGAINAQTAERLSKALKRILRDERAKSEGGVHMKKQIGGYKLVRRIGEGGMGEVYLAEQLSMHRTVALKILHAKWADDEEFRKRFLLEARAAGKLSHQNLIGVYDVGKYQGLYYFAMEYIDGVTVDDLIRHEGPMVVEKAIDIVMQVCEALKYLAGQDIVHRDIKPANVMITKDGQVKLGDFGFIQSVFDGELMQEGTTIGTPDYISPEQARGERNLDVRSDIYSLGATLFHMLSGKTLFTGSCSTVMRAHIDTAPPKVGDLRRDLPRGMVRVLEKMVAKTPIDRYQSPDEVIKDLELAKLDMASGQGELPSSRSQILNVISAEKARIADLERQLAQTGGITKAWMVLAAVGWVAAVVLLVLLLAG